jgi:hypothetical protein
VLAGLVSVAHCNVLSGGSVFDDDFLGVGSPVEECTVKEESVGTGALSCSVRLAGEINVGKTCEG